MLASLALARGFFPRRPWSFVFAFVLAGTLADIDLLSLLFGPSAYLSGRNTWTHSILGILAITAFSALVGRSLGTRSGPPQKAGPTNATFPAIFAAACFAATVHFLMDLATSSGITVLWPFAAARFAWDVLPATDPWILSLLIAGLLLPEVFRLVSSEIGVKDKSPRGRNGALIALALVCHYTGARVVLHGDAAAQLDAHSYHGETPRRIAALPDSLSLFTWHGIVETTSEICTIDAPAGNAARFDPETAVCVHKPEPSPALTAAQQTDAAQRFLAAAQFPKASVAATDGGTEVVIRDMRDTATNDALHALAVRILLDPKGLVTSQRILWARHVYLR